jgi:hypothetical protein
MAAGHEVPIVHVLQSLIELTVAYNLDRDFGGTNAIRSFPSAGDCAPGNKCRYCRRHGKHSRVTATRRAHDAIWIGSARGTGPRKPGFHFAIGALIC